MASSRQGQGHRPINVQEQAHDRRGTGFGSPAADCATSSRPGPASSSSPSAAWTGPASTTPPASLRAPGNAITLPCRTPELAPTDRASRRTATRDSIEEKLGSAPIHSIRPAPGRRSAQTTQPTRRPRWRRTGNVELRGSLTTVASVSDATRRRRRRDCRAPPHQWPPCSFRRGPWRHDRALNLAEPIAGRRCRRSRTRRAPARDRTQRLCCVKLLPLRWRHSRVRAGPGRALWCRR